MEWIAVIGDLLFMVVIATVLLLTARKVLWLNEMQGKMLDEMLKMKDILLVLTGIDEYEEGE